MTEYSPEFVQQLNTAVSALLAQNEKSQDLNHSGAWEGGAVGCKYRFTPLDSEKVLKCTVGHLITDYVYTTDIEGKGVSANAVQEALTASDVDVDQLTIEQWAKLQGVHDHNLPEDWKDTFKSLFTNLGIPVTFTTEVTTA